MTPIISRIFGCVKLSRLYLLPHQKILARREGHCRIVIEISDGEITASAEQATHSVRFVIVINCQASAVFFWRLATDGAYAILSLKHLIILRHGDVEAPTQIPSTSPRFHLILVRFIMLALISSSALLTPVRLAIFRTGMVMEFVMRFYLAAPDTFLHSLHSQFPSSLSA